VALQRVGKDGTGNVELASFQPADNALDSAGIATDGTNVFWSVNGELRRTPCVGGTTQAIASVTVRAFDGTNLYSTHWSSSLLAGGIDRVDRNTGVVSPWLAATGPIVTITVAGPTVVFADLSTTDAGTWSYPYPLQVWQAATSGTTARLVGTQSLMTAQNIPQAFVSDADFVYWFAGGLGGAPFDGALRKASLASNAMSVLATGFESLETRANVLALDDTRVYLSAYLTPSSTPSVPNAAVGHAAILAIPK
jgi:hypothetical protein